jgi:hypothetical protein
MIQSALHFIPQEKSSQKNDLLDFLFRYGSITRMQAFTELGICELSSRIGELERDGWIFPRQWKDGRAANGRKWRVVQYMRPTRGGV